MNNLDLPALIIFIRNPKLGYGKTRLAADVGIQVAFEIYLELLDVTRKLVSSYSGPKYLFYTDFIDLTDLWDNEIFEKRIQKKGDLGTKMKQAFGEILNHHSEAMIIGSDCPYIQTVDLKLAVEAIQKSDIIVGPAEDGGYYLLGMKKLHTSLFSDINWSSPTTLTETLTAAAKLNLEVHQLNMLNDIDDVKDWESYQRYKVQKQRI